MPDYSNGLIYTIRCRYDESLIYVGSTTQSLHKRWYLHKRNCFYPNFSGYNMKLYQKIRETSIDDWYIELYEEYPCNDKLDLHKREGDVIREIGTLNMNIAGRDYKERYEDNKDKIIEKVKQYYCNKKEDILEKRKQYYCNKKENILEKRKQYYCNKKEQIQEYKKQYYCNKKEQIIEKRKQYYEQNKDKFKQYYEQNKDKFKQYYISKKNYEVQKMI